MWFCCDVHVYPLFVLPLCILLLLLQPEEQRLQVSVLLKLSDQIRNTFDYCELQIPLLNG